ncbi:MAG: 6-bladed beta-propeller, partial [Gammaproteobacteria bacterium]
FGLDGSFKRTIGQSGKGVSEFNAPGGIAVNSKGELFIADFFNQRVQKLTANGDFLQQWGQTGQAGMLQGKLNYPTDVAVDNKGTLYIADGYNDRIQAFDPEGNLHYKWGGPFAINIFGSFNGWFATVTGISVGPDGNIFVADFYNDRVQKFTPEGDFLNTFGIRSDGPTHTTIAVAVANDGSVFIADYANHQIQKWQPGR